MDSLAVESLGLDALIQREWLIGNGIGGFASGTACGMNTRKYHGLLVAAMAPPVRRLVILSRVDETVRVDGSSVEISCNEYPQAISPQGYKFLRAFSPDPFPRWAYQSDSFTLEKSLRLVPGENTVCVTYTLLTATKPVEVELRPLLALRPIHELTYQWNGRLISDSRETGRIRIAATSRTPEVFFAHNGEFKDSPAWHLANIYRREQERGYAGLEDLWVPGVVSRTLSPGQSFHLVCAMEPADLDRVLERVNRPLAHSVKGADLPQSPDDRDILDLSRAASPFVLNIAPSATSRQPETRATWIATHYPWASPSLRAGMISMSGLLLVPGRFDEARAMLESAAALSQDGVIPSLLPEDSSEPVFHGADTSLWFANAVYQYWRYTADEAGTKRLLQTIDDSIEHYRRGTHLGIRADSDGLISTDWPGIPTTWMDAKLVDWIITPRNGRPVEINALWHNALRLAAELHHQFGNEERERELTRMAEAVQQSFNERFWNAERECLYDVVQDHGNDASIRPNQIFAISLPFPVLWRQRHANVIDVVMRELLTPMGVRTLSPRDPAYQGRYQGNVIQRDRAYHNGSAYPWLLGALVTAIVKTRGRTPAVLSLARELLRPILTHVRREGMGLLCELFDGDSPQRPGGALACAPATGEILRCWYEDVLGILPGSRGPTGTTVPTASAGV